MTPPNRKTLVSHGPHGRTIRVLLSRDEERVLVQRYVGGKREILRSWPNTRDNQKVAREWAKTFANEQDKPRLVRPPTIREIWEEYVAANFERLRPRSQVLYTGRWKKWELFIGANVPAEDATQHDFDRLRKALTIAPNQVRAIITVVKVVYRWAERRERIARNRLSSYRFEFAKEEKPLPVPEYTPEEYAKILAALDPAQDWKPWAILTLLGDQGVRVNAALHLRWEDVGKDLITWPARYDKTGEQWTQPIREATRLALVVAFAHKPKAFTPWVFFGRNPNHPYRVQSLWYRLTEAEKAAGVTHRAWRAMHGARRKVVGDAFGVTGSLELAGEFVNQRDVDTARGYLRDRGRRKDTADALDLHPTVTDAESKTEAEGVTVGESATSDRATGRNRTDDHSAPTTKGRARNAQKPVTRPCKVSKRSPKEGRK